MWTGQRPFRGTEAGTEKGGATAAERVRYAHLYLPPPDPQVVNPTLSAGMASVIQTAMAKRVGDRFTNAQSLLNAACLATGILVESIPERIVLPATFKEKPEVVPGQVGPQPPRPEGTTPLQDWWRQRANRTVAMMVGGVALAVLVVALATGRGASPPPILGTSAPEVYSITEPPQHPPAGGSGRTETTSPTPSQTPLLTPTRITTPSRPSSRTNGQWIAFTYGNAQDSNSPDARFLSMLNLVTGEERRLTFDDGGINFPSFSPDGSQIVYTGCKNGDCKLYLLDVFGGTVGLKIAGITQKAMWPSWCRQSGSTWIAYEARSSGNSQINQIDIETGEITALTNGPEDGGPAWSPDCSKIAFLRTSGPYDDIFILNPTSGDINQVVSSPYDEGKPAWSPDGQSLVFTRVMNDTNGDGFVNWNDHADLYMVPSGGGTEINLTQGQYSVFAPSFSPDGTQIAFIDFKGAGNYQQIYIYSLATHQFSSISEFGAYYHSIWSP